MISLIEIKGAKCLEELHRVLMGVRLVYVLANGYHQMYDNSNTPCHVKSKLNTMIQTRLRRRLQPTNQRGKLNRILNISLT